jgi:hypothetical protein
LVDAIAKANDMRACTLQDDSFITDPSHQGWSLSLRLLATKGMTYYMSRGFLLDTSHTQNPDQDLQQTNQFIRNTYQQLGSVKETRRVLTCLHKHKRLRFWRVTTPHQITTAHRAGLIKVLGLRQNYTPRQIMEEAYIEFEKAQAYDLQHRWLEILRHLFLIFFDTTCANLHLKSAMVKYYKVDGLSTDTVVDREHCHISFQPHI